MWVPAAHEQNLQNLKGRLTKAHTRLTPPTPCVRQHCLDMEKQSRRADSWSQRDKAAPWCGDSTFH